MYYLVRYVVYVFFKVEFNEKVFSVIRLKPLFHELSAGQLSETNSNLLNLT